jgi:hypothetical protein
MNKFLVFPCIDQNEEGEYKGPVVALVSTVNSSFVLFFPISKDNADLINFVLKNKDDETDVNINNQLLGLYQTMIDSWRAGDRFLSGIIMDTIFDEETKEDIISTTLIVSDATGNVDSVLTINFVHAILFAAMERKEILVANDLIEKLLPMDEEDEEDEENEESNKKDHRFPVDKQILDIAKEIMNGKKKDDT